MYILCNNKGFIYNINSEFSNVTNYKLENLQREFIGFLSYLPWTNKKFIIKKIIQHVILFVFQLY